MKKMKISTIRPSLFEDIGCDSTSIFVVIDTFRATTTLSTLKNSGVERFHIVKDKEDAKLLREEFFPDCLLIGEEDGIKIKGFDYGNSPSDLLNENLSSKHVVFTSTNGAKAMMLLNSKVHVYLAALVNLSAVAETISNLALRNKSDIIILPAGIIGHDPNHYSIEDWVTAAYLVRKINERIKSEICEIDVFWKKTLEILSKKENIESLLINTGAGQYLKEIGFGNDVLFASSLDRFDNFLKVKKWQNLSGLKCVELE